MNYKNQPNLNSRSYEIIVSKPFLCAAACAVSVIKNAIDVDITQDEIAEFYGVNHPPGLELEIKNTKVTSETWNQGIIFDKEGLNKFFKYKNLPLTEKYIPISTISDEFELEDQILTNFSQHRHIIFGYSYGVLSMDDNKYDVGHVSIVTGVSNGSYITILDPGPDGNGLKNIPIDYLYSAIRYKKDGLWVISTTL